MAGAHGKLQLAQGIAHYIDLIAHLHLVAVAQHRSLQAGGLDLQNGQVVYLFLAHDPGLIAGAVMQHHSHRQAALIRVLDHVIVGKDVAVLGEDEAGAGHGAGLGAEKALGGHLGGDAHHLAAGQLVDLGRAHEPRGVGYGRDHRALALGRRCQSRGSLRVGFGVFL